MIKEIKVETNEQWNKLITKMINELKKDTNEQLSELRKTMQDMKENFNEELEVMEKNEAETLEMKISFETLNNKQDKSEEGYQDLKTRWL